MVQHSKVENIYTIGLKKLASCASVLALLFGASAVQAQETTEVVTPNNVQQIADDNTNGDEITVTGTRLKSGNATSPVTTITQDDLRGLGITTVEGALRLLPQNTVSSTAASSLDGTGGSRADLGVGSVNLRGFGSDNTLVLVNGRRPPGSPSNLNRGANTNTIPFAAIERIEVLTDGASAIYGADAVAGVVNIILKKGYEVPERVSVRYEAGENGGDVAKADVNFGKAWDTGNFSAALSFQDEKTVTTADAGYTTNDFTSLGGPDFRITNPVAIPGVFSTADRVVDLADGLPEFGLPPGLFPPGTFTEIPGALLGQVNAGRDSSVPITLGDFNAANIAPFDEVPVDLTGEGESITGYLNIQQDMNENFSVFAEGNFAFTENRAEIFAAVEQAIVIPASNAFNGTGQDLSGTYGFDGEVAAGLITNQQVVNETESIGFTVGGTYETGFKDWTVDGSFSFGREQATLTDLSSIIFDSPALAAALADSNPATALNVFGDGAQQNAATLDQIFAPTESRDRNTLLQYQLSGNGDLFETSAGTVSAVIGADYRDEKSLISNASLPTQNPKRDVLAIFGEIGVPLISSDMNIPGFSSLEFRVAARWEEYNVDAEFRGQDIGRLFSNTSPSAGFAWGVTPSFKVRGNIGQSFRAPLIQDLTQVDSNPDFIGVDTFLAIGGVTVDPVTGLPIVDQLAAFEGNPELGPELSDTRSLGFDWTPQEGPLDGFNVSFTYADINTKDGIGNTFALLFLDPELFLETSAVRDANNVITAYSFRPLNFSQAKLRALDLELGYDFELDWGDIELGLIGTRTLEQSTQVIATEEADRREGTANGPDKTKFTTWVDWRHKSFGARLAANYSSSYTNEFTDPNTFEESVQRVSDYLTFDLTGQYETESGWAISGGVRNIADADFPVFFNQNGAPFDSRRVDVRGRTFFVELSKAFDLF